MPPAFATLDAVQAALGEDEALLSFQIGLWETYERNFGGGSWLVAVTKRGRTVHRLPDRVPLSDAVPVFAGLLEGGQGREHAGRRPPVRRPPRRRRRGVAPEHHTARHHPRRGPAPLAVRGLACGSGCGPAWGAVRADAGALGDALAAVAGERAARAGRQGADVCRPDARRRRRERGPNSERHAARGAPARPPPARPGREPCDCPARCGGGGAHR